MTESPSSNLPLPFVFQISEPIERLILISLKEAVSTTTLLFSLFSLINLKH
jgi:hypothetical protein